MPTYILGCSSGEQKLLWETDPYGRFYTRDIERAQREIPFRIVLPSYLPSNLGEYPLIIGSLREAWPEDRLEVKVTYQAIEGNSEGLVVVHEYNYPVLPPDPELNPGYKYLAIAETEVVETEHTLSIRFSDGMRDYPGFIFMWSQQNIYFEVGVYNYGHSEAIKIIESMIQQ